MGKGIFETAVFGPGMTASKQVIYDKHKRDVKLDDLAKGSLREKVKRNIKQREEYLKRKKHIEKLERLTKKK